MCGAPESKVMMCCDMETPAMRGSALPAVPTTPVGLPSHMRSGRIQCDALSNVNDAAGSFESSHLAHAHEMRRGIGMHV